MPDAPKLVVIYYSSTGTVYELAQSIVTGAQEAGADVRLLKVAELAPEAAIASNPAWQAHASATQHVPVATPDDVLWADAVIFGSPTRFGNIASQLKQSSTPSSDCGRKASWLTRFTAASPPPPPPPAVRNQPCSPSTTVSTTSAD